MKGWQQRVVDERKSLATKGDKLDEFLNSDEYDAMDPEDQALLYAQCYAMAAYAQVLESADRSRSRTGAAGTSRPRLCRSARWTA